MRVIRENAHMVSPEVWSLICLNLEAAPRKVFMLICSIKGLSEWLGDAWWEAYWNKHQTVLESKGHFPHWYLQPGSQGQLRAPVYRPILTLVYGQHCSMCGCRYHHTIHNQLKMRLCNECVQDHHISNEVLYFEYGLALTDVIADYEPFVKFMPMYTFKPTEIVTMSRNAIDVTPRVSREMVFFWLPDIRRLYDMDALRLAQKARVASVNSLKAAFKRRFAQAQALRHRVERLHRNEIKRIRKPMLPLRWFAGGPQRLAWCCDYTFETISHTALVERRAFKGRLRLYHPVPLLASNEYVLKTAISRLGLTAVDRTQWDIEEARPNSYTRRVYELTSSL